MRGTIRWIVSVLLGLAVTVVAAAFGPSAGAADAPALVRAAHFSPDTPGVDVYLTGFAGGASRLFVPDATYGGVSPYTRIAAGLYVVSMRPHGAAASTKPVISWNLDLKAGQAYTTAAIGSSASLKSIVLHDDLTLPPAGDGRIRLIQAASRAPQARVVAVNGPTVAADAGFATTTGYSTVKAGTWTLQASALNSSVSTSARISVPAGSVTSLLLLDGKSSGIAIKSVLDAASAGVVPVGAVPAGGGGTATRGVEATTGSTAAAIGAAVAALGGAALLAGAGRRARRRRLT